MPRYWRWTRLTNSTPSNRQIIESLLSTGLQTVRQVQLLFDMGRNTDDRAIISLARDRALALSFQSVSGAYPLLHNIMLYMAQYDFDAYLQVLEWNRKPEERFYLPRRKQLAPIVNAINDLINDRLDELFISQPPRTGKTTLMIMFVTYILGKHPEKSNLYCSYSDTLTNSFYNGVLEVIQDPHTYAWNEVFPNASVARTDAKDELVDINRKKHFPSLTCRSLYGTLNGACDARGILISDDLLSGIEEALSKDRLATAWGKVDNNMLTRAKLDEGCKLLWCGTRWSIEDPIGKRLATLEDPKFANHRYRVVNIPALNDDDESNFDYAYGVGFSTETYHQRRASFEKNEDMASWLAQYMGEPIEREGTVFSPKTMRYYNGVLPDERPVRIFMAVDPAWGGGDFCAGPVCYKYENGDIYVPAVIFSAEEKTITQPRIIRLVEQYKVGALQIEASKMTEGFADDIDELLRANGLRINLTTKPAVQTTSKAQRIFDNAPDIREHMIFLDPGKRDKEYNKFMENIFSFKVLGKNRHDDAPDSCSQAIEMDKEVSFRPKIVRRLW